MPKTSDQLGLNDIYSRATNLRIYFAKSLFSDSQKGALQKPEDPNAPPKPQVSETERKLKKVQKTLEDIAKLRLRREQGEPLEVNQLAKIDKEQELLAELQQLILEENGAAS